jgi:hypothetical protein
MDLLVRLDSIQINHSWVFINLSKISSRFASFLCFSFQNQIFVFNCLEEDQRSTQQHCIEKYENFNKRYLNVDTNLQKKEAKHRFEKSSSKESY